MKFVSIATKGIKETVRDRKGLAMLLVFPMTFMLVFGFAFGAGEDASTPHEIVVLNYDEGTVLAYYNGEEMNFGDNFTEKLRNLTYENSTVNLFEIQNATDAEAEDLLMRREIPCIVIIPENFSDAMHAMINATIRKEVTSAIGEMMVGGFERNNTNMTDILGGLMFYDETGTLHRNGTLLENGTYFENGQYYENGTMLADAEYFMEMFGFNATNQTGFGRAMFGNQTIPEVNNITSTVIIKGDTGYIEFGMTQGILRGVLDRYVEEVKKHVRANVSEQFNRLETRDKFVFTEVEGVSGTEAFTTFDYQAPGIIVFALLLLVVGVAGTLAREVEHGTLERLKITKMKSFDLLFGTLIPWALVAIAQVFILFLVAIAMGYHWQGGITTIALAIMIGIIGGISSISLGLLVAAFSKSEKHAENLGVIVAVPMSFIVGAFFPLPRAVIGEFFGRTFQAYDVLPWAHTVNALRSVLTFGSGLGDVVYEIAMMLVLTVILFVLGVICFSKTRLRAE
jgi:ABC-type multidrug transport system permease subunit